MLSARSRVRSTLYAAALLLVGAAESDGRDDPLVTVAAKFNRAVQMYPANPLTYLARGNAWLEQQQYERALADYDMALAIKPDLTDALFNRALTYRMQEKYDLALADLNYLIGLHPNDVAAINNRAIIWSLKSYFDMSLREFERALLLNPGDPQLERNRDILQSIMQENSTPQQKHDASDLEDSYIRYDSLE
jgi:tetratricopeptide (TPR) repeat protein